MDGQQHWDALLAESFISGRRAGLQGLSPSLAEGSPGSLENHQWLAGWRSGNDQRSYEDAVRITA